MRLPPIPPHALSPEQRALYDTLRAGIEKLFTSFETTRPDGALLGRFNPWLHKPTVGQAIWKLTEAVAAIGTLPEAARQVAILVTGARFRATYELYAHVHVAREKGMAEGKVATIVAEQRPPDLTPEAAADDAAAALRGGGVLPRLVYERAATAFGARGVAELIHLVGLYALVCTTLNGFDVPIPEQQDLDQHAKQQHT